MRVLLVSPLDPERPQNLRFLMGGENTYTRTLLENPPKEVSYIHFEEALKKGFIEYHPFQKALSFLFKFRILPPDAGIKWFVIKGKFDLIHCHAYGLKTSGVKVPVVLSDSSSNYLFLRDYLGWGNLRLGIFLGIKKILVRVFKIYDLNFNLMDAPLTTWSEFARKVHVELGCDPDRIEVIHPGLPLPKGNSSQASNKLKFTILFIGTWFRRKGGEVLLEAYKKLKKKHRHLRLMVVGEVPRDVSLPKGVWRMDYLPREHLLRKIYPEASCLVLVPQLAEGFGLVVQEAASFGIPSIVSNVWALSELVLDGKSGFVVAPGSAASLEKALEKLIKSRELRHKMGKYARLRFKNKFSLGVTNNRLLQVYRETLT